MEKKVGYLMSGKCYVQRLELSTDIAVCSRVKEESNEEESSEEEVRESH